MKNIISLVALLVAFCLQAHAGTSGVLTYQVVGGTEIRITDCQTSASGTVTIPATLEGKPVTSIAGAAFYNCSSMTGIVIPANVTDIGNNQFVNCTALVRAVFKGNAPTVLGGLFDDAATGFKIYYGDDATGFTSSSWTAYASEIYDSRFSFKIVSGSPETIEITAYPSSEAGELDVPATFAGLSVTSIGADAFDGCTQLTRISLPDSITTIGDSAFYECGGLTTFTVPANVTTLGDLAFADAALTSLFFEGDAPVRGADVFDGYLPVIYYRSGAQGFDAFPWTNTDEYTGLYDFDIYKETIKITDYPDTETGGITIPETLVGKPVTRIGEDAFYHCDELTRISLPESLEAIYQQAFELCSGLTTITIPTNVNYIGSGAYGGCALDSVFFESDVPATLGASLFGGATGFTVYYRDGSAGFSEPTWNGYTSGTYTGALSFVVSEEEVLITDCLTSASGAFVIPSHIVGKPVTALEHSVFFYCNSLTSISIPDTVTQLTASSLNSPNALTTYSVASGNPVFSSLDGVVFNKTQTELIRYPAGRSGDYIVPNTVSTIADQAFSSSDDLYSIVIPESVETNGWAAFNNCSRLQQAVFLGDAPHFRGVSFAQVATNFTVYYPEGKTGFGASIDGYPTESFDGKFSLEIHSVFVWGGGVGPDYLTQDITITDYPEDETGDLVIPRILINRSVTAIGDAAFESCLFAEVTIPDSVTDIGSFAFSNCVLSTLTIPDSVTDIGDFAFYGCANLKTAIFEGDAPELGWALYGTYSPYAKTSVFDATDPDFMIYYFSDQSGYSSPTWNDYPATEIDLSTHPLALWLLDYDIDPNSDITQDPNGDGVDLLMEYALNLNPIEDNAGNTPTLDFDNPHPGVISIEYYAGRSNIAYTADTSTNLQSWTTSGVYVDSDGDYRRAFVFKEGAKQFLRLKVELDTE